MMYRLKHVPTGLYYQPHKQYSNNLSKKGKVYHNEGTARRVLGKNDGFLIDIRYDSIVYKLSKDIIVYEKSKHSLYSMIAITKKSDWIIEKVE